MNAQEIVDTIHNNRPVDGCDECQEEWAELGEHYHLWSQAPSDGVAQVLVEEALKTYLAHQETGHRVEPLVSVPQLLAENKQLREENENLKSLLRDANYKISKYLE